MADVLGYSGKVCVITGAASGMGAAAAELLIELGAEVHALDIGDVTAPVKQAIHTNMMDKTSVDEAIAQLPDAYRTVLLLRDIEEFDTEQTAEALDLTKAAVKTRLHRARLALRGLLEPTLGKTPARP